MFRLLPFLPMLLGIAAGQTETPPAADSAATVQAELWMPEDPGLDTRDSADILDFLGDIRRRDKTALALWFSYPLSREYPIPPILDTLDFVRRFDEVFDSEILKEIGDAQVSDWERVGQKGVMLWNGWVWLTDENGAVIHHQTKTAKRVWRQVVESERKSLHPSLRRFDSPILDGRTASFRIRVDNMGKRGYRYASWSKGKALGEKPDLVLENGSVEYQGKEYNSVYTFRSGNYRYLCFDWTYAMDKEFGLLQVYKRDSLLIEEVIAESANRVGY